MRDDCVIYMGYIFAIMAPKMTIASKYRTKRCSIYKVIKVDSVRTLKPDYMHPLEELPEPIDQRLSGKSEPQIKRDDRIFDIKRYSREILSEDKLPSVIRLVTA